MNRSLPGSAANHRFHELGVAGNRLIVKVAIIAVDNHAYLANGRVVSKRLHRPPKNAAAIDCPILLRPVSTGARSATGSDDHSRDLAVRVCR